MRYKKFKNAEIEVSQLAVGTWAIGGQNYGKVDKILLIQLPATEMELQKKL